MGFRKRESDHNGFGIQNSGKTKASNSKPKRTKKKSKKKSVPKNQNTPSKNQFSADERLVDKTFHIEGTAIARKTPDGDIIVQNFTDDDAFTGIRRLSNPEGKADIGSGNKAPQQITYEVNPDGSYRQIVTTKGYYDRNLGEYIPDSVVINEGMNIMDPRLINPVTGMSVGEELFRDNPGTYFPTYQGAMEGPTFQSFSGMPYELEALTAEEQQALLDSNYDGYIDFRHPAYLASIRHNRALRAAKKQDNFTKE